MTSDLYKDRWIDCTADAVLIRGYYFPWGTKRIPYSAIREMGAVAPLMALNATACSS